MVSRPWRRPRSRERSAARVWLGPPGPHVPTKVRETGSLQTGQREGQAALIQTLEQLPATPRVRRRGVPTTRVQVRIPTPMHNARGTGRKAGVHKAGVNLTEAGSRAKAAVLARAAGGLDN